MESYKLSLSVFIARRNTRYILNSLGDVRTGMIRESAVMVVMEGREVETYRETQLLMVYACQDPLPRLARDAAARIWPMQRDVGEGKQ